MNRKRLIAGIVTLTALTGTAAGAVAATSEKDAEQEVLANAAKRLGVSAQDLRAALSAAEAAQLDAAVRAGELTRKQADRIKEHRRADRTVLRLGPGRHHGSPRGHRVAGPQLMQDAASALGISHERLLKQLQVGRTLDQVAEDRGTSLTAVKTAVRAAATKRLDADLKAGRITEGEHADMAEHLGEHLDRLGERMAFRGRGGHHGRRGDEDEPTNEGALLRAA